MNTNPNSTPALASSNEASRQLSQNSIAQLVGEVYESAPLAERSRLLEHLIRPLGVLSLVAVANGIFAKIRFRSGWPEIHIQPEEVQNVQASDVITLVNHVQQVSLQAVDSLADMLTASPVLTSSAAAALLVTVLMQHARNRRADD